MTMFAAVLVAPELSANKANVENYGVLPNLSD